jgi:hypothetical protein
MCNNKSFDLNRILIGHDSNGKLADHFAWYDSFGSASIESALNAMN